ncbi:MAG: cobalt/nickel transport system permease protein [Methanolobus sp.]|nr:cobalt/nickel transport system permease protein [Methanolobus sp.]
MHIFEGFLPTPWWQIWFAVSIPVIMYGMYQMNKLVSQRREVVPLLAVAGAFIFVLSSLKLPSAVTMSSSHPTGTGMAAILFGPAITSVLGVIVLLYQSLFLAHGGLTTLGANTAAMAIIGPVVAYVFYRSASKAGMNFYLNVFLATALADLATYVVTSVQLALAFPSEVGGVYASFTKFALIFAVTQIPLAVVEGALTALIMKYVVQIKSEVLVDLNVLSSAAVTKIKEAME